MMLHYVSSCILLCWLASQAAGQVAFECVPEGAITFEKYTNKRFAGTVTQTSEDVTVEDCISQCRADAACFSINFALGFLPTLGQCELMSDAGSRGQLREVALPGSDAAYYIAKICVRASDVCGRPWTFDIVLRQQLDVVDKTVNAISRMGCLEACLEESDFTCRSASYNNPAQECTLSRYDRLSRPEVFKGSDDIDYIENHCLATDNLCEFHATFERSAHSFMISFTDKIINDVPSLKACQNRCQNEQAFICRSFNWIAPRGICQLYHNTKATVPAYFRTVPSLNSQVEFREIVCLESSRACDRPFVFERVDKARLAGNDEKLLTGMTVPMCQDACLNEREFVCQSFDIDPDSGDCYLSPESRHSLRQPVEDDATYDYYENNCVPRGPTNCQYESEPGRLLRFYNDLILEDVDLEECRTRCSVETAFICRSFEYMSGTRACFLSTDNRISEGAYIARSTDVEYFEKTVCTEEAGIFTNCRDGAIVFGQVADQPFHGQAVRKGRSKTCFKQIEKRTAIRNGDPAEQPECNTVQKPVFTNCRDGAIVFGQVADQPFTGKLYAKGRSKTCFKQIENELRFEMEIPLNSPECNTVQKDVGVFVNTVVVQHHPMLVTKQDKAYRVACRYNTLEKTISNGPVNVSMINLLGDLEARLAPGPVRMTILDITGQRMSIAAIGDSARMRLEFQQNEEAFGMFAHSCKANTGGRGMMFMEVEIIDSEGCPTDPAVFPGLQPDGNRLISDFKMFKFATSSVVFFNCQIRFCKGPCPPAICPSGESGLGRRRRREIYKDPNEVEVPDTEITTHITVLSDEDDAYFDRYRYSSDSVSEEGATTSRKASHCVAQSKAIIVASLLGVSLVVFFSLLALCIFRQCKRQHE
ncbi:PREDICTED: uncharacterized protein LOC106807395 [Priapulus caudatus]|uniref:Uncharacterized protein LOC106807395 n=1 Tax=Priapulus caudatus TaxID=37621 RepID=A0ABM1DZ27_PRICU|nr:PREDICTED: uncharacterized protein LOC106807395 [Priapulus caudatus]